MFKKGVVIKPKKMNPINLEAEIIVLFSLFLCGVILGAFVIKNCDTEIQNAITTLFKNYISAKSETGFIGCFSGITVYLVVFIIVAFLFGLCAVGTPFVWLVPVVFGVVCSCHISLMLINYGFKGLFYCVMVNLLPYAITTATLLKCCCVSTKLSLDLLGSISCDKNIKGQSLFKEYILSYLVLCLPVVISSLISTICFKIFQGLFIFA